MTGPLHILGIAGSLRRHSYNHRLLLAAAASALPDVRLEVYGDLGNVPLFSEDLEHDGGPPGVRHLRRSVEVADAVLFATPEYNQSIPGVLKNAVDWLSRSDELESKPVAVIGATTGPWGTRLAQAELRHVLGVVGAAVVSGPNLYVAEAASRFSSDGTLIDGAVRRRLADVVYALGEWTQRVTWSAAPDAARHHHPAPASTCAVES